MAQRSTADQCSNLETIRRALAKVRAARSELESLRDMHNCPVHGGEVNYWLGGGISRWEDQLKRRAHELVEDPNA